LKQVAEEPVEAVEDPVRPGRADPPEQAGTDPDVRLMLAFRSGDPAAFDSLFRRWSAPLLRYLERMVRDRGSAEELAQEVFLRVHRARERYAPEARFSTWLYRIATNLALNELRRPRRREPHRSQDEEGAPALVADAAGPEAVVDARRLGARVESELARLPEKQRAALCLSAVEGLSYAEVAGALEVSEQAVKALVHRARTALAERLREGAGGAGGE
jgi:RNA polymerase sigma-70 factor (ECF subfamily)